MLNRRILRIKAMQALYGYFISTESAEKMYRQEVIDKYELDPAVHDFADKEIFRERQKNIGVAYDQRLKDPKFKPDNLEDDAWEDIKEAVSKYESRAANHKREVKDKMMSQAHDLHKWYLYLLTLPGELAFIDKQGREKREQAYIKKNEKWCFNLSSNPVIEELNAFPLVVQGSIEHKIVWKDHFESLRDWYKDVLSKDEGFIQYQELVEPTLEDHKNAVLDLYKKIVFKHDAVETFFEQLDMSWAEDKPILKSLVLKTVKSFEPDLPEKFDMKPLSYNLEEDFEFFEELFKETLKRDTELESIIAKRTKNWDNERIAKLDMIILKMAITEMMTFPSVPIKVTINEFIEISKNYSSPKSKQFVNGILDVLANELTSEGLIRKSGRGLIDNK
ncbi:MAG: transcription antitermination factor NusB [Cyclobacteriaceae bacterium]